jgi:Asp-tRNA(Asn)/Glu-tRNA(Gln) amidotransferase B subunit
LLPPPEWFGELAQLIEKGTIGQHQAKEVIDIWRRDMLAKIMEAMGCKNGHPNKISQG